MKRYHFIFDGDDDDVDISLNNGDSFLNNSPGTIAFWYKMDDTSSNNRPLVVSHEDSTDNFFQFKLDYSENKLVLLDDNYKALENADALILMTEWKMFRNPSIRKMKEKMKKLSIFDGRNQYDPEYMRKNGFEYKGIGR